MEDVERSVRLMKVSLRQFGFEQESGKIDIDKAEGLRMTTIQRNRVRIILDIINELTNIHGKDIPIEEIISRARAEGIENPDDMISKLRAEAVLYSSKPGFISRV
jgi:replicative DNA helicase Mcm